MNNKKIIYLLLLCALPACFRKKHPNTPAKNIKNMNFQEAQEASRYFEETGYPDLTIKSLERALSLSTDHINSAETLLKLADMYVEAGQYEKAQKNYKEFLTLYPGNSSAPYASYKEIVAYYKEINPAYRDQSKTKEVIELSEKYLNEFQRNSHTQDIKNMLDAAYTVLLEHEIIIIQFYLNKYCIENSIKSLVSTIRRLEQLKKEIIIHINGSKKYDKTVALINHLLDGYDPTQEIKDPSRIRELVETILESFYGIIYSKSTTSFDLFRNTF